jgi:hypothetical protein
LDGFVEMSIALLMRLKDGRPDFVANASGGWRQFFASRSASSSLPGTLKGGKSEYCILKATTFFFFFFK